MSSYDPDSQLIKRFSLLNLRELGGMPLAGGRTFAEGKFWRSSSPAEITAEEARKMSDYGVTCVIDLRSETELRQYVNPFANDGITDFHNIPLFAGDPNNFKDASMAFLKDHTLGDYYVIMLNKLASSIAEVLRILKDADGIALFHCAHGKDRTGVITAILYLLAGASQEDIITNYKVSFNYIRPLVDPLMARAPEVMKHALRSDASNMETLLSYINDVYSGDITKYLLSAGMTMSEIDGLRKKCSGQ
ncbi:MAG: tyrosine-protein phosphatase [Clostridiales bacterium]|nr:tyrosine-protein phosphatase [Clostridiales bacterium]